MNYIRERLADHIHKQWADWVIYMLGQGTLNPDGSITLSGEYVANLKRQVQTSYRDLSEKEQELDRVEADKILELMNLPPVVRSL